ncbi:MAG: hypothetical protein VXW87_00690 [Pseudomonadota bacterium]|nr:hypothetical protein [Pseudomonadota bacterium]
MRLTKRNKRYLVVAAITAVLVLLFRPAIFGLAASKHNVPDKKAAALLTKDAIDVGYIFSVAVEDRYYYLAQKASPGVYALLHVNPYHQLALCQKVKTTGFDHQFKPDIPIGVISSIDKSDDELYVKVTVSSRFLCESKSETLN